MLGPVDYVVIKFPGNKFNGEILPELVSLTDKGIIRIIDILFVAKDAEGNVESFELSDMSEDIVAAFGGVAVESENLLGSDDVADIADKLEDNSSAGILVLEHVWAKNLKAAIINSGGVLLEDGRIRSEDVEQVKAENNA